jgi:hypothetical protein
MFPVTPEDNSDNKYKDEFPISFNSGLKLSGATFSEYL